MVGSAVVLPCSFDFPQSSNESNIGGFLAQVKKIKNKNNGDSESSCWVLLLLSYWFRMVEEKNNSTTFCLRCGVLETAAASRQSTVSKQNFLSFQQGIHRILINRLNLFLHLRYVFHSAGILPDPSYQGRVEYFGQPGTNNCSLKISDLRQSDSGTYVFYLITDHPSEKMPDQSGIQLLVAGRGSFIDWTLNLSLWSLWFFFPLLQNLWFPSKQWTKKPKHICTNLRFPTGFSEEIP